MNTVQKTYGLPALASFVIPGAGQLLKGDIGKGLGILAGYIASWFAMAIIIGFVTAPALWIWSIYDAYNAEPVK